jgi:hypothetical protein
MSFLPRVTQRARELIAREFDSRARYLHGRGLEDLEQRNPEFLDMTKCAVDLGIRRKSWLSSVCSIGF